MSKQDATDTGPRRATAGRPDNLCGDVDVPVPFASLVRGGFEHDADDWGPGGDEEFSLADYYGGGRPRQVRFDDGEAHRDNLAAASGKGARADAEAALARLSTDTGECSEAVRRRPGEPCSSKRVVAAIQEFVEKAAAGAPARAGSTRSAEVVLPTAPTTDAEAVRTAAKVLGCASESCVVTHPKFRSFVASEETALASVGGVHVLDIEIDRRFKTDGPRDSTQLLSNFNIDGVLQEWAAAHPEFFNYGFNMMDFETTGGSLARTDVARILEGKETQNLGKMGGMVARRCTTFGCVLNTDVSSGRGKHWVAIFGDCRGRGEWSVEYFNSAGNPPPAPVTRWLEAASARLATHRSSHPRDYGEGAVAPVPLTDVRHQDSQTECGLYALYYIRRRLEGAPYAEFQETRIPDAAMTAFRKHVFRSGT
jgi:hypothetical protein